MTLIQIILILITVGVLVMLINKYGAEYIDAKFLKLINIVAVVLTLVWLLNLAGVFAGLSEIRIGA